MLKYGIIMVGLAVILSSSACKKDPQSGKGDLQIAFKGKFDSETMVLYDSRHVLPNGDTLTMQVLNFFLSDIKLVNDEGDTILVKEIDFVDFANNHTELLTAINGEIVTIENIPADDYTQILLGIGVSPAKNAQEPGDFPTTSPLGNVGNYWTAWDSYIFSRVEGRLQPDLGGSPVSFLYHSGVDGMYQYRSFSKAISITKNEETDITFELNTKEIFAPQSGTNIQIVGQNVSHSGAVGTDGYNLAKNVVTNLANALELK